MKGVGGKHLYFKLENGELPRLKGAIRVVLGTELASGTAAPPEPFKLQVPRLLTRPCGRAEPQVASGFDFMG